MQDLATALSNAKKLLDFRGESTHNKGWPYNKENHGKGGGDKKNGHKHDSKDGAKPKSLNDKGKGKPFRHFGYYICNGDHRALDCPQKQALR